MHARFYDNGGRSPDRFTAVYQKPVLSEDDVPVYGYRLMSEHPLHSQGTARYGESPLHPIDSGGGRHLGRRIEFDELPQDCQQLILRDLDG